MKVTLQGLGEIPTTIDLVLNLEKPDIAHIICSDYQLNYVASRAGYKKRNELVLRDIAKKTKTRLVFQKCDVFNPVSIGEVLAKIIKEIDPKKDEVIINYSGGTAVVRLLLGTLGVVLSTMMNGKVLYAIKYPRGIEITSDHTKDLKDIFTKLKAI